MDDEFKVDYLVVGTSLAESIVAAALAKAGKKVVHVDEEPFYGGDYAAFAGVNELIDYFQRDNDVHYSIRGDDQPDKVTSERVKNLIESIKDYQVDIIGKILPFGSDEAIYTAYKLIQDARQYSLDIQPRLVLSRGEMVELLISSGVGRHLDFKLLEYTFVASSAGLFRVPSSKEDVFTSRELTLIDKRKLMRFLTFAAGQSPEGILEQDQVDPESNFASVLRDRFKLSSLHVDAILYAIANVNSETSAGIGLSKTRDYLGSIGRYGNAAYLVSLYGGGSEIAQSYCRVCAVHGGIYILGQQITSAAEGKVELESGTVIKPTRVITGKYDGRIMHRAMFIYETNVQVLPAYLVLASQEDTTVHCLVMGQSVQVAPVTKAVVYAWSTTKLDASVEERIKEVLPGVLKASQDTEAEEQADIETRLIFSFYYLQKPYDVKVHLPGAVVLSHSDPCQMGLDSEVREAKRIYQELLGDEASELGFPERDPDEDEEQS